MRSIVYHQFRKELHIIKTLVLYIIKPTEIHTSCDEIQHGFAVLMIYTTASWWYTKPVGLDKKTLVQENECFFWSFWPESNRWPHPYQGCALPTEPQKHPQRHLLYQTVSQMSRGKFQDIKKEKNISKKIIIFCSETQKNPTELTARVLFFCGERQIGAIFGFLL